MTFELIVSIGAIFILMLLSAFFAGSETAMTASSPARMLAAEKEGNKRACLVNRIIRDKERLIGGILFGNNVVNITASSIAAGTLVHIFGDEGVLYASAVMTVLVVIFSEVMPKTYAFYNADRLAMALAPMVYGVMIFFTPITAVITKVCQLSLKMFGVKLDDSQGNGSHLEVLRGAIEMHRGNEEGMQRQRSMLRSILDLVNVTVDEVMIHRKNVMMVDLDESLTKLIDSLVKCPYSRIPVYRGNPENIVGVIHTKWLMRELRAAGDDVNKINLESIISEPWFIPDTTNLYDQLQSFRDRGEHFAFIVDEYGVFQGIVTLEDILEEIVGEIADEHDSRMPGVRKQQNGTYLVNGEVTIRDLRREFDWELPDDDYTTIAGLLLYETRKVPDVGQRFSFHGFDFEVVRRVRNQITLVRLIPPATVPVHGTEAAQ